MGGCCRGPRSRSKSPRRAACRRSPIASRRPCTANFRRRSACSNSLHPSPTWPPATPWPSTCPAATRAAGRRGRVVPDKAGRVARFHRNRLKGLAGLIAAAGLTHPNQLRPHHIVQRVSPNEVRLLSHLLPFLKPGELLEGGHGEQ